jgi:hypothetical protein
MDMTKTTTTAALRPRSESSFVVPSGVEAFWHLAVSRPAATALGVGSGIAFDVPNGIAAANTGPMVARDTRTTKQARPPRGNPR